MPRPRGPPLLVACYDNKIADVRKLLASGADPQAAALALAARLLARHRLGPQSKRFFELICECGGDSEKAAERLRAGGAPPVPPDRRGEDQQDTTERLARLGTG